MPFSAIAAGIDDYVPPPMFGETRKSVSAPSSFPPLPPHRPAKLKAPRSYVEYLRKHGKAPEVRHLNPEPVRSDISQENLVQPTARDIWEQINSQ